MPPYPSPNLIYLWVQCSSHMILFQIFYISCVFFFFPCPKPNKFICQLQYLQFVSSVRSSGVCLHFTFLQVQTCLFTSTNLLAVPTCMIALASHIMHRKPCSSEDACMHMGQPGSKHILFMKPRLSSPSVKQR